MPPTCTIRFCDPGSSLLNSSILDRHSSIMGQSPGTDLAAPGGSRRRVLRRPSVTACCRGASRLAAALAEEGRLPMLAATGLRHAAWHGRRPAGGAGVGNSVDTSRRLAGSSRRPVPCRLLISKQRTRARSGKHNWKFLAAGSTTAGQGRL